jgi:hypothetical protein
MMQNALNTHPTIIQYAFPLVLYPSESVWVEWFCQIENWKITKSIIQTINKLLNVLLCLLHWTTQSNT